MRKRRNYRPRHKRVLILTALLLCVSILLAVCFCKMQPVIMRYAVSVAETIMLNSANDAVIRILDENDISYNDIVRLTSNSDGYVTSLEIDIYQVNNLKSRISNTVSQIIEEREFYEVLIPVGTFLGNTYTTGLGPRIKFNMQLTTTAFVNFSHEFKAAGINQVLHIIMVDMKINGSLIIVGYNKGISVETSAIAAQTVIVGKSPDAFTNVIEEETDNTAGLINDYGAIS
ncbi:MAG: hypothetical protein IKD04_08670 [Clostridia bacterium]|nr:hypothetical protein [Clostridia bacterium]